MMNLTVSKLLSIIILGSSSVIVGILPKWFAQQGRQQWPLFLSSLLCFGGGVLLSTSFVHILPELRESIPEPYRYFTEIIYCLGFFILYILDEIVHYFYGDIEEVNILHNTQRRHSYQATTTTTTTPERQALLFMDKQLPYNRARSDSALFCVPSQLCHVSHHEPCHITPTANFGLLTALSIHALLEGLVVGLETRPEKVLLLLGAIASHKLVVSFCLGMELSSNSSYTCKRHFMYILIFSIGSAAGIFTGMLIYNIPDGITNILIPILQGLAGGTLLYVTVSEVLPRERARWHQQREKKLAGIFQFLSVFLGFVVMTTLSYYLDYDG